MTTRQTPQLRFSLVWADADIHELVVYACSEHFAGEVSLYVAPGELAELGNALSGFPTSRNDQRTFVLGQADLSTYGQVRGTLYCRDSTGHVGVHIELQVKPAESKDRPESCAVLLTVVPSDLDRFTGQLRCLAAEGQSATLANAA